MGKVSPGSSAQRIGSGDRNSLGGDRPARTLERSSAGPAASAETLAHDLSEGLATIALFSEALERRVGSDLDEESAGYLERIHAVIERMQSMIGETLRSERSRPGPEGHRAVDAGAVLGEALANVHARIQRVGAEVVAEPLPWVSGDAQGLARLFQNLLANSVKFRDPTRPVRIRVGAWREGRRWRLEFADNGIGINPELAERVLDPSSSAEIGRHPGDGLGLTICRRIVEDHGGRLRAAPRSEGGTTVSFDLAAAETRGGRLRRSGPGPQGSEVRPGRSAAKGARKPKR